MDGPISTSEAPGASAQFTPAQMLNPALAPPEKVTPVSKDSRPRSASRDEVGEPPGGTKGRSSDQGHKAEEQREARKEKPAYFVEIERADADRLDGGSPQPEPEDSKEPLPLPGDPSRPKRYDDLADVIAAAKERWAEVNRETLEANALPLVIRYQSLAMALSNPHQTRPIIDLFV